jgi:hypothetical protein
MAVVYEVSDTTTGKRVALKRPRARSRSAQDLRAQELFAREYHTLSQLAHPRIVAVYDYGHDEQGPFYTMELLDGGDLRQLVRPGYLRVCAIARDICSALSLLHSRRMLHRDLSARNVRCTADGTAKLIDFGAMTLMGPNKELIGTPAYAAPELVHLQPLDARTDLYALGATLYFALTGHHAYPVRDFAGLPGAWSFAVAPPSELVPDIPRALDALVLELLALDPANRPRNAAEVMERLAAIEGRPLDEQLLVAQAYLSTPAFVGRAAQLKQVRSRAERTLRSRGGALLVQGPTGVGRSRFLDASVLAAKLAGVTVLRADADASEENGEYGVIRALISQLTKVLPEHAPAAAESGVELLGHIAPELLVDRPDVALKHVNDASALRPELQGAIRQFLLAIATSHPLLIAVDDLHHVDESSVATLALLGRALRSVPITIVATAEVSSSGPLGGVALGVYARAATALTLEPLDLLETRELLGTMFGDSLHLDLLVHRLWNVAQGYPRDLMRLAQHLLDRGIVRYRGGAWLLPTQLDPNELPESVSQLLRGRVSALRPSALMLARALALRPDNSFGFDECCLLAASQPARMLDDLQSLVAADILRGVGERVALSDRTWVPLLLANITPAESRQAHLQLAELFELRGHEEFRAAQHLLRAGEQASAIDGFVAHAIRSQEQTDRSPEEFYKLIRSLPEDWLQTYEEVLDACRALGRPMRQIHAIQARLTGLVAVIGLRDTRHIAALLADLKAASGLDDWAALDPTLEPMARLTKALEATQARYDAAADDNRMVEPVLAIRALARAFVSAVAMRTPLLDLAGLRALPSLAPLAPLSPALALLEQLVESVQARICGRSDHALARYKELLERSAAPDRAGFDVSHHRYLRVLVMNGVGMLEASMGLASSLNWAQQIAADPLFQVNAVLVRMLYQLWQGNCVEAERDQRHLDALRIEISARQSFENTHLAWQVTAHALMEDVTRLKRTVEEIVLVVGEHAGWQPVLAYGNAESQRIRGDGAGAITSLEAALATVHAGQHQIWPDLAGAHVRALEEVGRDEDAVLAGCAYLASAQDAELGFGSHMIRRPLAIALAKLGQRADAERHVEHVIKDLQARGSTGLNLVLAYEARARVAIAVDDKRGYELNSLLFHAESRRASQSLFSAKSQRLTREAQLKGFVGPPLLADAPRRIGRSLLQSKLGACAGAAERARVSLALLAEQSGASEGYLYRIDGDVPVLAASLATQAQPSAKLQAMVAEYLAAETQAQDFSTGAAVGESATGIGIEWNMLGGASYRPVLLSHYDDESYVVTGLAVFALSAGQRFIHPTELAALISRLAVDAGDVSAQIVSDD